MVSKTQLTPVTHEVNLPRDFPFLWLARRPAFPRLRQLLRALVTVDDFPRRPRDRRPGAEPGGGGAMPSRNLKGDGS